MECSVKPNTKVEQIFAKYHQYCYKKGKGSSNFAQYYNALAPVLLVNLCSIVYRDNLHERITQYLDGS